MGFAETQADFAAALGDPSRLPSGVSARNGATASRFAVYRNNVAVALIKALEQRFPVTERLVGEEFFRQMAAIFASARKPSSPLIFEYGEDFPDFIDAHEAAASVPYLADVARLEAAWSRAYHAADAKPLGLDELSAIDPEMLVGARVEAHPAAFLLASPYPFGSIWAAHQTEPVQAVKLSEPETVLVARPAFDVTLNILPRHDAPFAAALFAGETIGSAAEAAISADPAFDFGAALIGMTRLGAFGSLQLAESPT